MRQSRINLLAGIILLLSVLCFWILRSNDGLSTGQNPKEEVPRISGNTVISAEDERPALSQRDQSKPSVKLIEGQFSSEMERIVKGIHAGRTVEIRVGDFEGEYVFRAVDITEEEFQITAGPSQTFPAVYEVFEGRQILKNGKLSMEAKLAVVNDTLSMAFTNQQGAFLIERDDNGEMVAVQLSSNDPESDLGAWVCQEKDGMPGVADASDNMPKPVTRGVEISLGGDDEDVESPPKIGGARVDHPYFRLGPQYDASLKDISVLMISGSTQTGASSNFSSRAASYFTYSAFAADVYERQLGMRFQLQELILIADDSGQPDIEYDDSVTANNPNTGSDDLNAVRDWCNIYRPQSVYQWGHVAAWTLANGDSAGTIGWSWIGGYGSSNFGVSVNERQWEWGVLIHEMGHNVGADHTNGGVMNPSINASNPQEDFFRENATSGGGFTAAKQIYDYMSVPSRSFVTGPADLRNPDEMPFGVDDLVSTPAGTPITFNPLANDSSATPLFGTTNNLRLVEVGQIYPIVGGTATFSGNQITFTPSAGYTGRVWFSYTLSGDVGNGGQGWFHSADVVVTVGGDASDPTLSPGITTVDDVVKTDFSGDVRLNPLLNDEGKGRLWAGGVDAITSVTATPVAQSYSDGAFFLVSATVLTGNGSVTLETADMTRNGTAATGNTGYLVYTPGVNEPNTVEIQYTVEDEDGNQATGMIRLLKTETVSVASSVSKLVESEGRVATLTISRTGSTATSEWVDFLITGAVSLTGADSDIAISGFDFFDGSTGKGRVTILAGQSSVELKVSAMEDAIVEDDELCSIILTGLQTLVVDSTLSAASLEVSDIGGIGTVIFGEDFESFPLGVTLANGWINTATSPGSWTADRNGTASSDTGPNVDHTLGTGSGTYLYREASGNSNQQADLTSPTINLVGASQPILEFYYHMFGSNMGELRVDVFSGGVWNNDVAPALIGQQQESSGEDWRSVSIDISSFKTADFQVRFRGITGSSFRSDMAIDDVRIGEQFAPANETPAIEGQPQSIAVRNGDSAYFSVVVRSYPSPTYQWRKNGSIIPGATRSVYSIASVSASDAANYTCDVTSGVSVTSATATLVIPPDDLDQDGMADSWEVAFFGNTNQLGTGDFDGDGVVNFLEYALGTVPNDRASQSLPTASVVEDTGSDYLTISYRRLQGGIGTTGVNYTAGGVRYTVQYDVDLTGPWSSGGVEQVGPAISNGDGTETVTVRVLTPIDVQDTLFMRVLVIRAP